MTQRCERLGFPFEACEAIGTRGDGWQQYLDRHTAPEPCVTGTIDLAHPASAEHVDDFISAETRAGTKSMGSQADGIVARDCAIRGEWRPVSGISLAALWSVLTF